ncbi:MAG: xanthine dehydrogenase family protein molybdopterin-binding subunit [Anaerolineae bacterium]|jgi:CO/xanthine dehydrogenase Mo-binding subunit
MTYKERYQAVPVPEVELPELRQVGKPLRRIDALGKTTGSTVYAGDYTMPNMLHGKVFRSTEPSARISYLDVSSAESLDGVVCVLTADDLPDAGLATDMPGQTGTEERKGTRAPVLASDRVRFYGEPIALVAAVTEQLAERALELIKVDYEPLQGVFDPMEALKPDAPVVYEPDNVVARWKIRKGDVEAGFAVADEVLENTFRVPFVEHAYLEPEAGVSWVDDQGVINIRVSTQVVEHFRKVADAVGVPQNKIRTRGAMVGGGFGGKEDITVEIFLALLAKHTRRPVRLVYTREESFIAQSKRHPFTITHRTGVKRSGRITAAQIDMVADAGAYPYLSPYVLLYATIMSTGPYKVDNLQVDSVVAATNQPFTSAMRGFGGPQAAVAYEQQMDEIADALDLDPLEVRRVNYLKSGERNATGQTIDSAAWLEETATHALSALGDKERDSGPMRVGRGLASTFQSYGRITWFHDTAQAWVGVEMDGAVVVRCGVPDHGGGQVNSLAQIAGEVLGVPMDEVTVYSTDSAVTPLAGTTTATRQLYMSGNAVHKAAAAIRKVLLERASKHFEEPVENLDLADSQVFVMDDPSQTEAVEDLVARCASEGLPLSNLALFTAPFTDGIDRETGQGDVFPDFTFGAQAVEVAVDIETGEVTVLKSAAAHDVGRAINPAAVVGQIQGGAEQGMGYALMEDFVVQEGVTRTPSFSEYLIPTAKDFPDTEAIVLESGTGVGPFGAKGIGEPALTPAAPAIANAVADAIGVRIHELPITPERVLKALERLEE